MKYVFFLIALLSIACGKPKSQSESKADSLRVADSLRRADSVSAAANSTSQNTEYEVVESDIEYEAEDPRNDALSMYAGEYTLQSASEAEDGTSLTLTYVSGNTFNISITVMVADFCSGSLASEISFDENNTVTFDGAGHPVTVKLVNGTVVVEDPERQLGVGTCEFNGTFVNINGD